MAITYSDRRTVLLSAAASLIPTGIVNAQTEITRPVISEADCPLEVITPIANDGSRGLAVLRKPPGKGPFPVFISIHGGMVTLPLYSLDQAARNSANVTRF